MQSKKGAFYEAVWHTSIGYAVALAGQFFIYPLMGIPVSTSQNLVIGAFFVSLSLLRSYVIRRVSNYWTHHGGREWVTGKIKN